MAASFRISLSPVNRGARHGQSNSHDRRRDSRSHRPKGEHRSSRCSPPRQIRWSLQQLPTPMTTPNSSTPSLSPPIEHRGITMERTPSGNSIISDTPYEQPNNTLTLTDDEAASRVENHCRRHRKHERTKHERILRKLIGRDHPHDEHTLDDHALDGILTAADSVFFNGTLCGRVRYEWSSQDRYQSELIGTTALRQCVNRTGFECLIVLSEPILLDRRYERRLLLSAFLHELVHCYLFIQCGFEARMQGGHTKGFHTISEIIDNWVGPGYLSLCSMKANLNHFRKDRGRTSVFDPRVEVLRGYRHEHEGCNQSPNQSPRPDRDYLADAGFIQLSGSPIYI